MKNPFHYICATFVAALLAIPAGSVAAAAFASETGASVPLAAANESEEETPKQTSILFFQDAHDAAPVIWDDGTQAGGIARLATVIADQRVQRTDPILAFGGDLAGGTLFGGIYKGVPFVDFFNQLGVDVAGFGQHDFDFGTTHTRALIDQATFPWISSNIQNLDGTPFSPDGTTQIVSRGGIDIGFLSLTGDISNTTAGPDLIEQDHVQAAKNAVAQLEKAGADVIVALTQNSAEDTETVLDAVPEISLALREEVSATAAPDIVLRADGRYSISGTGDYSSVIRADVTVNDDDTVSIAPTVIPVNGAVANDPEVFKTQQKYTAEIATKMAEKIGSASTDLDRAAGGQEIAKAFREQLHAQVGWANGGGARAALDAGDLTIKDAYSLLPFGNMPVVIETNGKAFREALEQGIASNPKGFGGFPRVAGISYTWDEKATAAPRVTSITWPDGTALEDGDVFTLALTDYVRRGGDKVDAFQNAPIAKAGTITDAEVFIAYVRSHGEIPAVETGVSSPATEAPSSSAAPSDLGKPSTQLPVPGVASASHTSGALDSSNPSKAAEVSIQAKDDQPGMLARTGAAAGRLVVFMLLAGLGIALVAASRRRTSNRA